ncbi:MAG: glycosyltransferase 87 family protein [Nocardioidaceae bacterium]|nr:glycosyltransferase 87 family protein [Nocardioidaceae bacterium]MCL2612750.1 glycosyltransferase 87 family protein [Nocardioidaceae bacterium]
MEEQVHPTLDDGVVGALSGAVGGPMGQHALPHRWWTPTRVLLLLTAVVFSLGLVQKAPCALATGKDQDWTYSHMCYTDLRPLYVPRGFAELKWPYSSDAQTRARYDVMEYPVGISYWAWGTAWVTHWLDGSPDVDARAEKPVDQLWGDPSVQRELDIFTLVNAVGFAALALLSTWLLARVDRRRPWDAAIFALSPTLLLTGLINWDLLAVATVAGALWAWSRGRPLLTGVLIGIGTATKLYPLLLLGGVLVLCVRQRRWRHLAVAVASAAVAWLVVNAPALLTGAAQWKVFWASNATRSADLGSLWQLVDQASGANFSAGLVNHVSWAVFGGWCVAVLVLGLRAERATLAQLGFLVVVGFLIVNKVYSPQYVLWLLPLAALARPRWRDQIVWQACEVFYFCTIWWFLGGYLSPVGGGNAGFYWLGIVVRVVGEVYLVVMILRDMYRVEPTADAEPDQPISTSSGALVG